jgi:hypothetical protein
VSDRSTQPTPRHGSAWQVIPKSNEDYGYCHDVLIVK